LAEVVLIVAATALDTNKTKEMAIERNGETQPLEIRSLKITAAPLCLTTSPEFIHQTDAKEGPPVAKLAVLPAISRY
jgi:hypothetical protein